MIREVDVAQLVEMGFGESQVREALTISGGNLDGAINYILTGPPPSSSTSALVDPSSYTSTPRPSSGRMGIITAHDRTTNKDLRVKADGGLVQCHLSQYSFDLGRSACTCIALTAATKFLQQPNITTDFLEGMLTEGISNYTQLMRRQSLSVEHLSAEEVLQQQQDANPIFAVQILPGGIRQGLLSHDFHHPMGFQALLEGIRFEQPPHQWMAILITKTPETVLVCFPPPAMGLATTTTNPTRTTTTTTMTSTTATAFWLIDSHPRPQLGVESAYAKLHPSLDALCLSLQAIFPCTELGPDIPEMMAMMYNSFDLYPLLLLPSSSSSSAAAATVPTRTTPSSSTTIPPTRTTPSSTTIPPTGTTPSSTTIPPTGTIPSTTIPSTRTIPAATTRAATTSPPPTPPPTTKRPKKRRNRGGRKK